MRIPLQMNPCHPHDFHPLPFPDLCWMRERMNLLELADTDLGVNLRGVELGMSILRTASILVP